MREARDIHEMMLEMKKEYSMDFLNLLNDNERQHCFFNSGIALTFSYGEVKYRIYTNCEFRGILKRRMHEDVVVTSGRGSYWERSISDFFCDDEDLEEALDSELNYFCRLEKSRENKWVLEYLRNGKFEDFPIEFSGQILSEYLENVLSHITRQEREYKKLKLRSSKKAS